MYYSKEEAKLRRLLKKMHEDASTFQDWWYNFSWKVMNAFNEYRFLFILIPIIVFVVYIIRKHNIEVKKNEIKLKKETEKFIEKYSK